MVKKIKQAVIGSTERLLHWLRSGKNCRSCCVLCEFYQTCKEDI